MEYMTTMLMKTLGGVVNLTPDFQIAPTAKDRAAAEVP